MPKKNDFPDAMEQREQRRRSVVRSMVETPAPAAPEQPAVTVPAAGAVTAKAEQRTKHKHILLQPSLHDRAEAKCKALKISMNEAITQLLQGWVDGE